jgi:dynein heavy chain, axonemal
MNPKSISSGQLYGNFDENTHEWSDGILAVLYRNCSKDTTPDRYWVMFDGPVDAVWIENMNTVLDDNKKLCLMSGEIIKMTDLMTMMFEAEDLEQASPATVSRVGMIFCETRNLGWRPLRNVWIDKLKDKERVGDLLAMQGDYFSDLFEWLIPPTMYFVQKNCAIPSPVTPQEMVFSCLRLMDCFLDSPDGFASDLPKVIECLFIMAIVWSIGACVDSKGRALFNTYFRAVLNATVTETAYHQDFLSKNRDYVADGRKAQMLPPDERPLYDYKFDAKKGQWAPWMDAQFRFAIPKEAQFNSIVVPTLDTIRNEWLLEQLIVHNFHVLCTGDTGTGKTVSIKSKLLNGLGGKYTSIFLNFSAQTGANQTQDIIDNKLDKRRKGVLGPPLGLQCVIFVDDLNMPAKETYGAQPPIEILRQWMDHAGWYNREENSYTNLVDIQFVAAMGPPGGGRTRITQRYVRHFNLINFVPFSDESLGRVFGTILDWFLNKGFPGSIKSVSGSIVTATVDVYNNISENLLPTPAKSHYTFNLRDMSKVFQGVLQVKDCAGYNRLSLRLSFCRRRALLGRVK